MFKRILVPTDGSPLAGIAAGAAVRFAKETGAAIVVISVAEPLLPDVLYEGAAVAVDMEKYQDKALRQAQKHVDDVAAIAMPHGVPCETVAVLSPTPDVDIVSAADARGCDVIFIASHGRSGLDRLFLGSTTQKVLARADIPVLVFRQPNP